MQGSVDLQTALWRKIILDGLGLGQGVVKTNMWMSSQGQIVGGGAGMESGVRPESEDWGELSCHPKQ